MISSILSLLEMLDHYASRELNLEALHDQLSLGLQEYFDNASDEDIEIFSEVLSAIYEVEDGVLDEEEFRKGPSHHHGRPLPPDMK
jgi:hypothetical protein